MEITYSGGPIVRCPIVYNAFWGPAWADAAHQALAAKLNQFQQDLLKSKFMNVLTQYGILGGTGALIKSMFLPGLPQTLTVASYQSVIQSCIDGGFLPDPGKPTNNVLMVYLDENTIIKDPATGRQLNFPGAADIGYHDHFTTIAGSPFYYAFMAYFADAASVTPVACHEFAEMITDPEYTAWTPDHGMTEIGDLCETSFDTIVVGSNTWTIQKVWSDLANTCVGQVPAPLPPISPGPGGAIATPAVRGRGPRSSTERSFASHERILPLPPVVIDLQRGTSTMAPTHAKEYLTRIFHPVHHSMIMADLPKLLRTFADLIEGKPGNARVGSGTVIRDESRGRGVARHGGVGSAPRHGTAPKARFRPLNVCVGRGSRAEKAIHAAAGTLVMPSEIAPGFPSTPEEDLIDHGGKIIADLTFTNFYVGGQDSWNANDIAKIDRALAAAIKDNRLNNVMRQYLRGQTLRAEFRPSAVLPGSPPAFISQGDVEGMLKNLLANGKLAGFPLASTVFNFMLPSGTVLTTDEAPANSILSRGAIAKANHMPDVPVEDEDSSLEGLGGYHGSIHALNAEGNQVTVYYAVGVFSQTLADGSSNGIPFFSEPWKNVVATFYHELCEARTDPDVEDAIKAGADPAADQFLGWVSKRGEECGDGPMREAGENLNLIMQEITLADGSGTASVQFQYSNRVHGPEGPTDTIGGNARAAVTFDATIKPYFTPCYREHMLFLFDLWSIDDVKSNWQDIYDAVANGSMPRAGCPEGVWNAQQQAQFLADFQSWKNGGLQ